MIINRPKRKGQTVDFREIIVGDGFRWQNWYYIKIEECYHFAEHELSGGGNVIRGNAIQLETGLLAHFVQGDLVEKIPMSIEVLE